MSLESLSPDCVMLFGAGSEEDFKMALLVAMRDELAVLASSSSTEEDKKVFNRLLGCLTAEVSYEGPSIKASSGIDESKLPPDFIEKNRGLIDLVNSNLEKKCSFTVEVVATDKIESGNGLTDFVVPMISQLISDAGGGS